MDFGYLRPGMFFEFGIMMSIWFGLPLASTAVWVTVEIFIGVLVLVPPDYETESADKSLNFKS
jgi:hypothetical protein